MTHLKKNKTKGAEEFPRVRIIEEFPRVRISEEFPRKSIVTEPPFGKDIVNLEKKYGTISGYKMYPFGRAIEEFVEQEHPRDEGGQFTDKDGSQSEVTRDRTFGRIIDRRKENINRLAWRIQETKRKMTVIPENTLNYKSLFIKLDKMESNLEMHMKDASKAIADRQTFNEMGLFEINMGNNTHEVGSKGFRNGATKNLIKDWIVEDRGDRVSFLHEKGTGHGISAETWDKKVKGKTIIMSNITSTEDDNILELQNEVSHWWNEVLSDKEREGVDVLRIKYSDDPKWRKNEEGNKERTLGTHGGRKEFGGIMMSPSVLTVHLSYSDNLNDVLNTVIHEGTHARWAKLIEPNKEKMNKFTDKVVAMGKENAVTEYAGTYFDDLKKIMSGDINDKDYIENVAKAKQLLANETHSEYFAMVGSPTNRSFHASSKEKLKRMSKMIKEDLYD